MPMNSVVVSTLADCATKERGAVIVFPIGDLLDEQACYDWLLKHLHPDGPKCPNGHAGPAGVHERSRAPIIEYCRKECGHVFNVFTKTLWQESRYCCSEIIQTIRAFAQGTPTLHLARELKRDRSWLLVRRHRIQGILENARPNGPLSDTVTEADEMYQNAGEKRDPASRSR